MTNARSLRHRKLSWVIVFPLFMALLAVMVFIWYNQATGASIEDEPFKFNHKKHLAAGVECLFCHPGTLNGAVAGIPSTRKCIGCHGNIEVTSAKGMADVETLLHYWEEGIPLRWKKVNDQPDFVRFDHRPHIVAGVNCESCHGNVREMEVLRPAYRVNMGFCLQCHRQQPAEKQALLTGCVTCHR